MIHKRKLLLATAAVVALGLGMPSQAQAFDEVDWNWVVDVNKNITEDIDVNVDVNPTGMTTIESLQHNIGDINATSTVTDFQNNPPGIGEGGTVTVDEIVTVTSNFNKPVGDGNSVVNAGGGVADDGDSPLDSTYLGGTLGEQANGYTVINDVNISGEFAIEDVEGVNDAIDLPKIENTATAVANNFSLDSATAVNVNSGQINYGDFNVPELDGDQTPAVLANGQALAAVFDASGNEHVSNAYVATLAGALGIITQGEVNADATSGGLMDREIDDSIINASVENAATAVGNNFSVNLEAISSDDAFMVADNTQFNYADVTANASVIDLSLNSYTGFGAAGFGNSLEGIQTPIISNVATAVGNNASITVTSPGNVVNGL